MTQRDIQIVRVHLLGALMNEGLDRREACTRFAAAGNIGPDLTRFLDGDPEVQSIEHIQAIGKIWPEAVRGVSCPECHQSLSKNSPGRCRIIHLPNSRSRDSQN